MILRSHPLEGARLAAPLASWLGPWAAAIAQHHERFDGFGYPAGLAGEEITLGGRIVAVTDAFETMTAVRSYKPAITAAAARNELTKCAGTQFDPTVVRAFLEVSVGTHHFLGAPIAWLGDLPLLSSLPRLGQIATSVGHAVVGVAVAAGAGAAVVATASHAAVPPPPPAAQVIHPASPPIGITPSHATSRSAVAGSQQTPSTGSPIIPTPQAPLAGPAPTLPGAPTAVIGVVGDHSVDLAWTPPSSDGGSGLTGYSVTPSIGGVAQTPTVFTSTADVESISGLTNGTSYTFTVSALNGVGPGPASIPSGVLIPITLPGPPTAVSGMVGDGSVSLAWTPPSSDGGSAVTGYIVTPSLGGVAQTPTVFTSTADVESISGLTNGTTYTFTVSALNGVGLGPASIPSGPLIPATLPGTPTAVFGMVGDGLATLSWTAPTSDGGSAVTGYIVTPSLGGVAQTPTVFTSTADVESISGLTNGTSYTFTVSAVNGVGVGPASIPSGLLTPVTRPGPPTALSGIVGNGSVTLSWTPPSSDGGSAVTGYIVTPSIGGVAQTPTAFTSTADVEPISGLANGTSYTFTVCAVNGVGVGPASIPSGPLTPVTRPGPPTALSGIAGDGSVTLSWTAPSSNGGSAITGFVVTPYIGGVAQTPTVFTSRSDIQSISGLTNGTSYTFTVSALNGVGPGPASIPSGALTPVKGASSMTILNGSGVAGRADQGDQIILKYSTPPIPGAFCSAWAGGSYPTLTAAVVTAGKVSGKSNMIASITDPADCPVGGFHFGRIDLGLKGYFKSTVTFANSTIQWNGADTLTITLGAPSVVDPTNRKLSAAIYTPDPVLGLSGQIGSETGIQF